MKKIKTALILAIATGLPSVGYAGEQLIEGVENKHVLMGSLGFAVVILFVCLMALTYLLAKALPNLINQQKVEK